MQNGLLCIVLHTHLPFVRHPEYADSFEEHWLFEAITETYMPLIKTFTDLVNDGIDFRLTMSVSPTLSSMLTDHYLQERYMLYIERLIELAEKETHRTRNDSRFNVLACMYLQRFTESRRLFEETYKRDLLAPLKQLQELGKLELITCSATHCFFPVLESVPKAIEAQLSVGCDSYSSNFQVAPQGIWSGECGYFPGLERFFERAGLRYSFVDTHGVLNADHRPRYGVYAPLYCPNGVAMFGRDPDSSKSVWSAHEGYPGDFVYRDFYRDIGYDLDADYLKPHMHESGNRVATGIKYYRITGKTDDKQPYNPRRALGQAAIHAKDFLAKRIEQINRIGAVMDRPPLLVTPFDTELFGHWWYEGVDWLNFLLRSIHLTQDAIKLITPTEYLNLFPDNQIATPCFSSWGSKGYASVWLEGSNDWIYRHVHKSVERMIELATTHNSAEGVLRRALNQCAREILLAQASDWAFIMTTNTVVEYAKKRVQTHVARFTKLYNMIASGEIDKVYLRKIAYTDNLFPNIDYSLFAEG